MLVFGLTGGIASGKSVVSTHFRSRGVAVIDADELSRQVTASSAVLDKLVEAFGPGVRTELGELNRSAMAAVVFQDLQKLARLNQIVHPEVRLLFEERVAFWTSQGADLVCYDVPLLFENHLQSQLRPVVLVSAKYETQVERAIARNGWTREEAEARIRAQLPLDFKRSLADYIIENDADLQSTLQQADAVLETVRKRSLPPVS